MIQYVRDENKVPIAIFIADQVDDRVVIGFAVCNAKDSFSKERGKTIAMGRAHKWYPHEILIIPQRVASNFFGFLEECIARQVFQGKTFPTWVGDIQNISFPGVLVDVPRSWEPK
jgi:hypothetical protein